KQKETDESIIRLKFHINRLNRIYAFITNIIYNFDIPIYTVQTKWTGKDNYRDQLIQINSIYQNRININDIPARIKNHNDPNISKLRIYVAALRNSLRAIRIVKENNNKAERIKYYEDLRCTNFAEHKAAFIASALNRSKRSIILDRAMCVDEFDNEKLLTDPTEVKLAAIEHFKTIAGAPPSISYNINTIPSHWQDIYRPMAEVDINIYQGLLNPITDDEWSSILSSLPNNKAPGKSGIPYEILKNLPTSAQDYLKELINECMHSSMVPSAWRDATVYPIPKPTEWYCFLKNTRPITLLETVRKLLTKLIYRRLSDILVKFKVLKGSNFAGLPGGSCDPPICALEAILQDAKTFKKPLFIFQQDISKAFDSIDTNMLRLAMLRLKIPSRFVDLTIDLFSNRFNSIITAFGNTSPYKVQIGIDQGEVISPLLWVIYIDPLLTMLNQINPAPYRIDSDPSRPPVDTTSLCFMDDTNLFASSSDALNIMLNFAQEFYNFNNTKINFSKAILICNRDPHNNEQPLPVSPIPYTFNIIDNSFNITPIAYNDSFRFLGVWFTLSLGTSYVKKQCSTEYRLFAAKLKNKRLTSDQLTYLHNMVLLPKVCYRLKATSLSEEECSQIMAPFKRVLKNSMNLTITLPDSFIHSEQFIN